MNYLECPKCQSKVELVGKTELICPKCDYKIGKVPKVMEIQPEEIKECYLSDNRDVISHTKKGRVVNFKVRKALHKMEEYYWLTLTLDSGYELGLLFEKEE